MLQWLSASEAQAFGRSLANVFCERVPVESRMSEKQFAAKTKAVLRTMETQIAQYRSSHSTNFYQKAQLGNAFKWSLRDVGYESAYVDEITEWVILHF